MGNPIVIVGSGIVGLYTGFVLAQQDRAKDITFVAEFMPGDQSHMYTSPWAGGNFSIVSGDSDAELEYDRVSFLNLKKIHDQFGPEAGIAMLPSIEYYECDIPSPKKITSLQSYIPDFKILEKKDLIENAIYGIKFTTFNFYSTFIRRRLNNIDEAFEFGNKSGVTPIVFNCTGIGAYNLGGVADKNVYPTRGQVVVIRAPHIRENRGLVSPHFETYVIPRPHSTGGHVVLGGYMQSGNWDGTATYGSETASILERTRRLYPEIDDYGRKPIEIVREAAGLRPSRTGGTRIEREDLGQGRVIIHNYGAGGTGYQSGYGMAVKAISLMEQNKPKL